MHVSCITVNATKINYH